MLTLLRENMQSDAFDDGDGYNVCNIYYDNANNTLIRASVSKPLYKEKLRVRSYGVPDDGSKVYVEVKKKTKGVVSKRRISMRLRDVEPFLICGVIPPDLTEASLQIAKELLYMQSIYRAVPKLYLAYRRFAFTGIEDERLRVTIDVDILTRRDDLKLESGIYDALIVELGSGTGDNWWCVLYPPLCFTSADAGVEYRSLIYDIIKKFFA